MLLVGLTGNIASGKSTVAQLFSERGATIIDADVLARRAVERGTPAFEAIVKRWGTAVLAPDQMLDRALRRIVFSKPKELDALNEIVHPEVERLRQERIADARARGDRIVVCDIPLLFEKKMVDGFDRIVLVDSPRPLRRGGARACGGLHCGWRRRSRRRPRRPRPERSCRPSGATRGR